MARKKLSTQELKDSEAVLTACFEFEQAWYTFVMGSAAGVNTASGKKSMEEVVTALNTAAAKIKDVEWTE